jgi:hypothetical protein
LYSKYGYIQDAGDLRVIGAATGRSTSTFDGDFSTQAIIKGGFITLGYGNANHRTTLKSSTFALTFWANTKLRYGINTGAGDNDVLAASRVFHLQGATAQLDTGNLRGNVPVQMWVFLTADQFGQNSITGAFTSDVGNTGYTISAAPNGNSYYLQT